MIKKICDLLNVEYDTGIELNGVNKKINKTYSFIDKSTFMCFNYTVTAELNKTNFCNISNDYVKQFMKTEFMDGVDNPLQYKKFTVVKDYIINGREFCVYDVGYINSIVTEIGNEPVVPKGTSINELRISLLKILKAADTGVIIG